MTRFFNSFQTLSQDSASLQFREQVKVTAGSLIESIHTRDGELKEMRAAAERNIEWVVQQINRALRLRSSRNKSEEVVTTANDLRDRRGALIKELSQYVEVTELDSGDYQLTTKDNRLLVINNGTSFPSTTSQITSGIGAGMPQAELEIRDTYVPKYAAALDQLAFEIAQQVIGIHDRCLQRQLRRDASAGPSHGDAANPDSRQQPFSGKEAADLAPPSPN